ncbi:hypothetical protein CBR_g40194 [Chara braunii]|uniref:Chloride conductance regulatory protein ICln n=1 Tax=Chara braunii TaxID=69332 RepID=A0A388LTB2_CHABU|nr:hypothetical protein CBR_g40194 [Chara braunii]|eukprot:GBG85556.1 hypothetical protein CBR_g40194 [Chara braunii]
MEEAGGGEPLGIPSSAMPAAGLLQVTERSADGSPVLNTGIGESLMHVQPDVSIVLGDSVVEEPGTLYITTKRIIWFSEAVPDPVKSCKGYAVDFLSLGMHAISRDTEAFARPCIFAQIENGSMCEDYPDNDEPDEEEVVDGVGLPEVDLSRVSEIRLVPEDTTVLDRLFQVLCECAALNPDPDGPEDGEGDFFYDDEEVNGHLTEEGAAMVDRLESLLQVPPHMLGGRYNNDQDDLQRFEDADGDTVDDEHDRIWSN